jgi:transketolase
MAPAAHLLWRHFLRFNPGNPKWPGRDRFVLSNGHGCALLYSMLHLCGYAVSMDDLKRFRQLGSITPGHPEVHVTPGVEATTGPLGQGISNAVGMAMAEHHLRAVFNREGFPLFDNYTYVFCGDGCLQEGVSHEACSLAGHLGLSKLIVIYDDNSVTIDGSTKLSFSEDVLKRFEAYGWFAQRVVDKNEDVSDLARAIRNAQQQGKQPSIIALKTIIGYGSKLEGTGEVHGSPLGKADLAEVKRKFGFDPEQSFVIPDAVAREYADSKSRGAELEGKWNRLLDEYCAKFPELGAEVKRRLAGELPAGWEAVLPSFKPSDKADATRNLSGAILNALAAKIPDLVGGSADLTPSTKTLLKNTVDFQRGSEHGRHIRFGVREHGMVAVANGLALYGGVIPFTATFLNFIEYAFPSVRLASISHLRQILVMTHDSIGLGEDGPTHQPIEALALCRATPGVLLIRPADGNETVGAYVAALRHAHSPTVMCLTRQNLPHLSGSSADGVLKGAYVLQDCKGRPDLILVGTGSEVSVCVAAASKLQDKQVRIVSMPCWSFFDRQPVEYRRAVLPVGVPVMSVEAASVTGWERYAHVSVGMTTFGASAPLNDIMAHFGFTGDKVAARASHWLAAFKDKLASLGASQPPHLAVHLDA